MIKKVRGFTTCMLLIGLHILTIKKQIERIELFADKIYEPLKELDKFSRGVGFVGGAIPMAKLVYE